MRYAIVALASLCFHVGNAHAQTVIYPTDPYYHGWGGYNGGYGYGNQYGYYQGGYTSWPYYWQPNRLYWQQSLQTQAIFQQRQAELLTKLANASEREGMLLFRQRQYLAAFNSMPIERQELVRADILRLYRSSSALVQDEWRRSQAVEIIMGRPDWWASGPTEF